MQLRCPTDTASPLHACLQHQCVSTRVPQTHHRVCRNHAHACSAPAAQSTRHTRSKRWKRSPIGGRVYQREDGMRDGGNCGGATVLDASTAPQVAAVVGRGGSWGCCGRGQGGGLRSAGHGGWAVCCVADSVATARRGGLVSRHGSRADDKRSERRRSRHTVVADVRAGTGSLYVHLTYGPAPWRRGRRG